VTSPVEAGGKKKVSCNLVLVGFKVVEGGAGGKEVQVSEVHEERLVASAHGAAHKDLSVQLVSFLFASLFPLSLRFGES